MPESEVAYSCGSGFGICGTIGVGRSFRRVSSAGVCTPLAAGAGSCPSGITAITNGQSALATVHFNGSTHDKLSVTQSSQSNGLAVTLDRYNNNALC